MFFIRIYLLDLFGNYTYLIFDKLNALKQGVLTPCKIKKRRLSNTSIIDFLNKLLIFDVKLVKSGNFEFLI